MDFIAWTRRSLLIPFATILLAACSAPYKEPHYSSRPEHQVTFPGLLDLAQRAPSNKLDVLLVHGMCSHDLSWAANTIEALRKAAGARELHVTAPAPRQLDGIQLYQRTLKVSTGTLRVNAIVWSPLVAGLKRQLCFDQTEKSELCKSAQPLAGDYPYKRAKLNALMKDTLLNDCLADAVIYQGRARDEISKKLQDAIVDALASSGGQAVARNPLRSVAEESANLVVITESLGSKLAFDALYRLSQSDSDLDRKAAQKTLARMVQVFMGANQIPILALGDQTLGGYEDRGRYPTDPLAALLQGQDGRLSDRTGTLRVVAFTDPNDLLSYVLVPYKPTRPYDVVDVVVSNDHTYFGLFENPMTAHVGYRINESVLRAIVCGNPSRLYCP